MYRLRYDYDYIVSENLRLRYDYDYFLNKIHDYDCDYSLFVIYYNRLRLHDYDYLKSGYNKEILDDFYDFWQGLTQKQYSDRMKQMFGNKKPFKATIYN